MDSFQLALYGRQQMGDGWLTAAASYEHDEYSTRRPIDFLAVTARGSYAGDQAGAYLEAGWSLPVAGVQVQPIAALQYLSLWRDGFTENGAGAADLRVASVRVDSCRSSLGGRLVYPLELCGCCLRPEARAFWVREYAGDTRSISNQFQAGGPAFTILGQNLGRDWGLLGVGVSAQLGECVRVALHYDGYLTQSAEAHGGMAEVELRW